MPGRKFNSGDYRFGFNGKENDSEWGSQVIQDYGFRIYNPSIGKFLSVDPLSPEYPELTPYQFAHNTPIWAIDVDGLEGEAATSAEGGRAPSEPQRPPSDRQTSQQTQSQSKTAHSKKPISKSKKPIRLPAPNLYLKAVQTIVELAPLVKERLDENKDDYLEGFRAEVDRQTDQLNDIERQLNHQTDQLKDLASGEKKDDDHITLYRGVSDTHPGYKNAIKGIAIPRGGHSDPGLHNSHDTKSIFTSWSTERWVAEDWALDNKTNHGIVLEKRFKRSSFVGSPDASGESEVLVPGIVVGAKPSVVTKMETKPKFDSKSGKYKDGGSM